MAVELFLRTRSQQGFFGTVLIQAIVVLVLVGLVSDWIRQWVHFTTPTFKTILCYLSIFALAEIFELVMSFNALRARNIIQILGILAFHTAMTVYAGLQIHQTYKALGVRGSCSYDGTLDTYVSCNGHGTLYQKVSPLLIAAPCVLGASLVVLLWWTRELYAEFGWAIFHIVGADPAMKKMYRYYQIMLCLLKFGFFFFIGVTIQLLIIVLQHNSVEYGLTIAAIPIVLFLLVAAGYAVQREIKWLMFIALILMFAAETYFYKLIRIWAPSSRAQYATTRTTLTIFTVFAWLTLFVTFLVGLRCFADFGKGLLSSKIHDVDSNQNYSRSPDSPEKIPGYQGGAAVAQRLSIE